MIASPIKIPLQLQRQRQNRHNKLMNMINSYQLSKQQKSKLQKIKSHTMMQISLRYLRSQINRNYKFPKTNKTISNIKTQQQTDLLNQSQNSEEEDKQLRQQLQEYKYQGSRKKKRNAEALVYDLKSQNARREYKQVKEININQNSFKNKFIPLEQSRRVHSLGNQRSVDRQKEDFIIKRHLALKHTGQRYAKSPPFIQSKSTKSLKSIKLISQTRKSSKQQVLLEQSIERSPKSKSKNTSNNLLLQSKKLKLPQIITSSSSSTNNSRSLKKLAPIHQQKLKTQKFYEQQDIQAAIGKKLVTQISDSGKKMTKGVQKYLKQLQHQKKYNYLGHNQSSLLKKQQKFKGNFGLIKTTKNSLKGQVDRDIT